MRDACAAAVCALSLHDALPICRPLRGGPAWVRANEVKDESGLRTNLVPVLVPLILILMTMSGTSTGTRLVRRSEEHTSELQSRGHLVCRLLLEKKNKQKQIIHH